MSSTLLFTALAWGFAVTGALMLVLLVGLVFAVGVDLRRAGAV
jgi:hypothetical protein